MTWMQRVETFEGRFRPCVRRMQELEQRLERAQIRKAEALGRMAEQVRLQAHIDPSSIDEAMVSIAESFRSAAERKDGENV